MDMYDKVYGIEDCDYWKVADFGLTGNQRKIYKYLFKSRVFDKGGLTNSEISKAVKIAPSNCINSLQGLLYKGLVFMDSDKKTYWIKRYDIASKAKFVQISDVDSKSEMSQEQIKKRKYSFELGYVENDMLDRFMFISDDNLNSFIKREQAIVDKHTTRLHALIKEKNRRSEK